MILVDTSVWIAHLRGKEVGLTSVLEQAVVLMHPFVVGELACGNLKDRASLLRELSILPKVPVSAESETLYLVEYHKLWGKGIGWVDANLVASALIANCHLWSFDSALKSACQTAGVKSYQAV